MREPLSPATHLVGERIRTARITLGLSQETVSELAQLHVTSYGNVERGTTNPSLLTVVRIAGVLGVEVATLTAGLEVEHLPAGTEVIPAAEFLRARRRWDGSHARE